MTVQIKDGKATIPLWAAIVLIVTILLATAGWVALAAEKANNSEHQAISSRVDKVEEAVKAIPLMQKDIGVITAILVERDGKAKP
jgi:type VI protein secretion system component VasK